MGDGFVEAGFEFGEEGAPAVVAETMGAAEFCGEVFALEDAVVEDGDDDGIYDEGAEFFHEVEGEGGFAVLAGVQVADVGVEADGADGGDDLVEEDGVAVAEEGVDGVEGWAAGAAVEEVWCVEEVFEAVEVGGCAAAFVPLQTAVGGVGLGTRRVGQGRVGGDLAGLLDGFL